jgi:hypothetical protein
MKEVQECENICPSQDDISILYNNSDIPSRADLVDIKAFLDPQISTPCPSHHPPQPHLACIPSSTLRYMSSMYTLWYPAALEDHYPLSKYGQRTTSNPTAGPDTMVHPEVSEIKARLQRRVLLFLSL